MLTLPIGKHRLTGQPDHSEITARRAAAAEASHRPGRRIELQPHPGPRRTNAPVWNHNLMRGAALEMAPRTPPSLPDATP